MRRGKLKTGGFSYHECSKLWVRIPQTTVFSKQLEKVESKKFLFKWREGFESTMFVLNEKTAMSQKLFFKVTGMGLVKTDWVYRISPQKSLYFNINHEK